MEIRIKVTWFGFWVRACGHFWWKIKSVNKWRIGESLIVLVVDVEDDEEEE